MTRTMTHAYQQAPWRVQKQKIGLFLLCLVGTALVAGLYLSITAQAVTAGVQVQALESQREQTQRNIANLHTQLAYLTSAIEMEKRAQEMGFRPYSAEEPLYLVIPEYPGRQTAILAPPPSARGIPQPLILYSYTQSLWEWLFQGFMHSQEDQTGRMP